MKKIVITPRNFHKGLIFSYQKNDPFYDVKFITKEDLFLQHFGELDNRAIATLLTNDELDMKRIKEISRYIPFANYDNENQKVHSLYLYNKDLKEKGFLKTNEYLEYFFKDKEIEIFGYSKDDKELCNVLNQLNLNYSFASDLKKHNSYKVIKYKTLLLETLDLLNNIANDISSGEDPNNIYIYTTNEDIISYLKQFHSSFNLPINFNDSISIAKTDSGKLLLEAIDSANSLDEINQWVENNFTDKYKDDLLKLFINNTFEFLKFDDQIDLFKSLVEGFKIKSDRYDKAINVISKPSYLDNSIIYVPGFIQGSFPKVYRNNEYISDEEKELLNLNTSNISTRISYWENMEFFDTLNDFRLSYAEEHLSNSYSISPIAIFNEYQVIDNSYPRRIYSKDYRIFLQTISFDLFRIFKEKSNLYNALKGFDIDYKNYDNSYTEVKHFNSSSKLKHSYTSISEYYKCPFNYYIESVLSVNEKDYGLAATIGTICHKIFESMFKDNFDFETCFKQIRDSKDLNALETLIIDALKGQLQEAVKVFLGHKNRNMGSSIVKTEQGLNLNIDENTNLFGIIDATYVLEDKYVVLVDYKTGSETVNINNMDYGLSLQLPIYAYLIKNNDKYNKYDIGGLYIQHCIEKSYSYEVKDDALFKSTLKLEGLTNKDMNFLTKFDYTFRDDGTSQYLKNVRLKKDGSLYANNNLMFDIDFDALAKKAEEKVIEANTRIRNNDFEIAPLKQSNNIDACKYCKNRDICFVRKEQFHNIEKEKQE